MSDITSLQMVVEEQQAIITELRDVLKDEKIRISRLQMIAYGAVDDEYAAYYTLALMQEQS